MLLPQIAEIKRLGATAAISRSELNEIEEQLQECKQYREFLDRVTPMDWFMEVPTTDCVPVYTLLLAFLGFMATSCANLQLGHAPNSWQQTDISSGCHASAASS